MSRRTRTDRAGPPRRQHHHAAAQRSAACSLLRTQSRHRPPPRARTERGGPAAYGARARKRPPRKQWSGHLATTAGAATATPPDHSLARSAARRLPLVSTAGRLPSSAQRATTRHECGIRRTGQRRRPTATRRRGAGRSIQHSAPPGLAVASRRLLGTPRRPAAADGDG